MRNGGIVPIVERTYRVAEYRKESFWDAPDLVYPEHDENYLDECIANLAMKGVTIDRKRAIERLNAA